MLEANNISTAEEETTQTLLRKADNYHKEFLENLNYKYFFEIERIYLEILKRDSKNHDAIIKLGKFYSDLGQINKAITFFKAAKSLNPKSDRACSLLGVAYSRVGEKKLAEEEFKIAVSLNPYDTQSIYNFCSLHKHLKGENYKNHIIKLLESESINNFARINLHFALANIYDALNDTEKAFANFCKGAELKKQNNHYQQEIIEYKYSLNKFLTLSDDFKKEQNKKLESQKQQDEPQLIFVVGVPRSGSTLIEQILSSNKNVIGIGETNYLYASLGIDYKSIRNANDFLKIYNSFDSEKISKVRNSYFSKVSYQLETKLNNKIIVDKLLSNFEFVAFIKKIFPEAKIIYTSRDAIASAWSSFKINFFSNCVPYSYSFDDLFHYYKVFNKFIKLWERNFPHALYNVDYETLVEAPEQEIKNLINYLDLDWDDKYLKFYENKRVVQTASLLQVRQKLYNSSIDSWKKYKESLIPIINQSFRKSSSNSYESSKPSILIK